MPKSISEVENKFFNFKKNKKVLIVKSLQTHSYSTGFYCLNFCGTKIIYTYKEKLNDGISEKIKDF